MNKESLPSATRECCHFTLPLHYIYVCYTCVQRPRALYQTITKSYGNHNGPMPRPSQKPLPEPLREQEPALSGSRPGCIQKLSGSSSSRCLPFFGKLAKVPLPDGRDWRHVHLLIGSHKDKGCKIGRVDARVDVRVRGAPTDHERRRCTGSSSLTVRMFERSNSHASYR